MSKRILVTGANGQLGQALVKYTVPNSPIEFLFTDRQELDITNAEAIDRCFQDFRPHYCLNTAAYTAVDQAETEPESAQRVNVEAVGHLARACKRTGAHLWHFSSDYVYHNQINRPLRETDPTEPKGVYAQTKLEGEHLARKILPHCTIIRTSWVYSPYGHNFVKTMLRLGRERNELRVVCDQIGAPTSADDLAGLCLETILQQAVSKLSGTFNYAPSGVCSWYDFARAIFRIKGIDCTVHPIPTTDYPTPAQRPAFSVLDTRRIRETFVLEPPYWLDSLEQCLEVLD